MVHGMEEKPFMIFLCAEVGFLHQSIGSPKTGSEVSVTPGFYGLTQAQKALGGYGSSGRIHRFKRIFRIRWFRQVQVVQFRRAGIPVGNPVGRSCIDIIVCYSLSYFLESVVYCFFVRKVGKSCLPDFFILQGIQKLKLLSES
jgi:hypothetical protein